MNKPLKVALCLGASMITSQAALTTVFEYSFRGAGDSSGSYDGVGTTITDLSGAGNDATVAGGGIVDDLDDRPTGFSSSVMALTGSAGGYGRTDSIDLLNNSTVALNGGFTMDVWFKRSGTGIQKLIDYAGTETLRVAGTTLQFTFNDGGTIIDFGSVAENQWYHAVGVFDTTGNVAVADPGHAGEFLVTGDMKLYIDDVLVDSADDVTKSSYGDRLNRGIGINRHPTASDYNQGMILNPTVSLGIAAVPEPSAAALLGLGGLTLILRCHK